MSKEDLAKYGIELKDGECCVIFDLACYFPYSNPEVLTFDFFLGNEEVDDYKLNHRYPNSAYQTISKKDGRKVSKIGYPYVMKLNESGHPELMLFGVRVGVKNETPVTLILPLIIPFTKEKPVCNMLFHIDFETGHFTIETLEKIENSIGYWPHAWRNYELANPNLARKYEHRLNPPFKAETDECMLVYDDANITLFPCSLDDAVPTMSPIKT